MNNFPIKLVVPLTHLELLSLCVLVLFPLFEIPFALYVSSQLKSYPSLKTCLLQEAFPNCPRSNGINLTITHADVKVRE